jgi:hypothetical protein
VQPISVISPQFEAHHSSTCRMSMLIDDCGIAIGIFDVEKKNYTALKYISFTRKTNGYNDINKFTDEIVKKEFLLRLPYQAIRCIYPTQCCTLIPADWLQPPQYKTQLEYRHRLEDLDEIHCCKVQEIGAECVFTAPAPLTAKLFEQMGSVTYVHQCKPLIHSVMQDESNTNAVLGINLSTDFANAALRIDTNFMFYNTFSIGSPQDLLYYILLIIKQFNLTWHEIKILLVGGIKDEYVLELKNFFDNVIRVKMQENVDPHFDLLFLLEKIE